MRPTRPRATVDANVFASGLIKRGSVPFHVLEAWRYRRFELVSSSPHREEIQDLLSRPYVVQTYNIGPEEVEAILARLEQGTHLVVPAAIPAALVRDPDDAYLIGTAMSGSAEFLVTGDKDLLVLDGDPRLGGLRVLTPRAFLEELAHRERDEEDSAPTAR